MTIKNLENWFREQELRRLTADNCKNLAHSCHDVDDDMTVTRSFATPYQVAEDVVDHAALDAFDVICFEGEEYSRICDAINLCHDSVEFNGAQTSLNEIAHIFVEAEPEVISDLSDENDDYRPHSISGRRLSILNRGWAKEENKSSSEIHRGIRAKQSSLKQDHRHIVANLPMLASAES